MLHLMQPDGGAQRSEKTPLAIEAGSNATTQSYVLRPPDTFAMRCAVVEPPPVEEDLRDVRLPGHTLTCASDRQDRIEPQPNIDHPGGCLERCLHEARNRGA